MRQGFYVDVEDLYVVERQHESHDSWVCQYMNEKAVVW